MPRALKPLTREDIERAMRNTRSNRAAAAFCRCSLLHYKRYAKLYKDKDGVSLYDKHKNPSGKGIPKFLKNGTGRVPPIFDILEGRVPVEHYNPEKLKYLLVDMGILEPKCEVCGENRKRSLDGKAPLILIHKNGDKKDWHQDNLAFRCYNCVFLDGGVPNNLTEAQINRMETFQDKNGEQQNWELDDYQREFLESLGLRDISRQYHPGEEYISKI